MIVTNQIRLVCRRQSSLLRNQIDTEIRKISDAPLKSRCLCGKEIRRYSTVRNVTLDHVIVDDNKSTNHGTPIVVAHALFGNKNNWNNLSKQMNLETGRKIVAYDAVNHGNSSHHADMSYESMAADLFRLMDQLEIPKAILIGHSMGGKTVMTAALTEPERVERLIVVDTVPAVSNSSGEVFTYMQHMNNMDMSTMKMRKDVQESLKEVTKSQTMINFLMTNLTSTPEGLRWRVNLKAFVENYKPYIHEFPQFNASESYGGPAQFIGGKRSKYLQESNFEEIYKRFPNASIEYVPDAGHWVHSEKPKEFLEIVNRFLKKTL